MQTGGEDALPDDIQPQSFLHHFRVLMGPYGLYQHATVREPLLSEGYCTDDNARAVQVLARLLSIAAEDDAQLILDLLTPCWNFLKEAQIQPGAFYNFRDAEGKWLTHGQSEDMYARLIRSFVTILSTPALAHLHSQTEAMLKPLLEQAHTMHAPRFWSECLIALAHMPPDEMSSAPVAALYEQGNRVLTTYWQESSSPDWPWFEPVMTYANALLPHGLLMSLAHRPNSELEGVLHASAAFLIATTIQDDMFVPIGSNGWYPRGGTPSHDNQQAIEAGTMFDFLLAYSETFPEKVSMNAVGAPYLWFFGHNSGHIVMADESTGACLDGIFSYGPNPNNGAESMLAYLWAEVLLRDAPLPVQRSIWGQKEPS